MSKPALVLLPGMLCDGTLWQNQTAHLSAYADITIADLTTVDSIQKMALGVLAESPPRFALAGLSLGGIVAFEMIRLAPEMITRLALLDTTPYPMSQERIQDWGPLLEARDETLFAALAAQKLARMMYPGHSQNPVVFQALNRMVENVGPRGFQNQLKAQINRPDSRSTLSQIDMPTLVLVGREDNTCPLHIHLEMIDEIPNAILVVIRHCGHLSPIERPDAITAVLKYWLR